MFGRLAEENWTLYPLVWENKFSHGLPACDIIGWVARGVDISPLMSLGELLDFQDSCANENLESTGLGS